MRGLRGKVAIVTGGAKNIGRGISLRLADEGVAVMIVGRGATPGAALAKDIRDGGGQAAFAACDVSSPDNVRHAVAETVKTFGAIDIVVNNAAATHIIRSGGEHAIVDEDIEAFDAFMKVGVYGPFLLAKYALPEMTSRGGGVFVSVSSSNAAMSQVGTTAYGPSKAALECLTGQIAANYGRQGIRAVSVRVGLIRTEENSVLYDHREAGPLMRKSQMLERTGRPEDVANMVAFVASDEAAFMTGTTVTVDAGLTSLLATPDVGFVFAQASRTS